MFFKCLTKSIDDAIEVINKINGNNDFEKYRFELFYKIVIAVHFIGDYEERIRQQIPCEYDSFIRGFLYLNNQFKHDCDLEMFYYDVCGSMFPLHFPMRFGKPGVYWNNFTDNGRKTSKGKREHYETTLMNKDIEETLLHILDIFSNIENDVN